MMYLKNMTSVRFQFNILKNPRKFINVSPMYFMERYTIKN